MSKKAETPTAPTTKPKSSDSQAQTSGDSTATTTNEPEAIDRGSADNGPRAQSGFAPAPLNAVLSNLLIQDEEKIKEAINEAGIETVRHAYWAFERTLYPELYDGSLEVEAVFSDQPLLRSITDYRNALAVLPMPVVMLLVAAHARIEGKPVFSLGQDADVDGTSYNVTIDAGTIRLTITEGTREQAIARNELHRINNEIARLTRSARAKEIDLEQQAAAEKDAKRDFNLGGVRDTIADLWATVDHFNEKAKELEPFLTVRSVVILYSDFEGEPYEIPSPVEIESEPEEIEEEEKDED